MADSQADTVKPNIIMKVDAPTDSDENQDNDTNEHLEQESSSSSNNHESSPPEKKKSIYEARECNNSEPDSPSDEPSQSSAFQKQVCPASSTKSSANNISTASVCSPYQPFTIKPDLSTNPFSLKTPTPTSSSKPFSLKPSNFNPFKKDEKRPIIKPNTFNPFKKVEEPDVDDQISSTTANGDLKFVPLVDNVEPQENLVKPVTNPIVQSTSASTSSFVFGQNLQERVIASNNDAEAKPSAASLNSNGNTDMIFSYTLKVVKPEDLQAQSKENKETKTLSESAREYEASRANKRKYEEVEVVTGEEGETNVLQISCKLFAYDNGNWAERGRGTVRLNDIKESGEEGHQSRLVVRASGSLRVVINTKIWDGMLAEQASAKSIRITVMDSSGSVKLYLLMSNPEDTKNLLKLLVERINKMSEQNQRKKKPLEDSGGN